MKRGRRKRLSSISGIKSFPTPSKAYTVEVSPVRYLIYML